MTPAAFEAIAARAASRRYSTPLRPGRLPGIPKTFDFVSDDQKVVGDAKFYTLVGGSRLPPAKFSVIAEYVWLLEKTGAPHTFLLFGNDVRVPQEWLRRYGHLATHTAFHFLDAEATLHELQGEGA